MRNKYHNQWKSKVLRSCSSIGWHGQDDYKYLKGNVATPHGIVTVYSQGQNHKRKYSFFDFIYNGYRYHRSYKRCFTERGLAIMANKFAKEIAANEQ